MTKKTDNAQGTKDSCTCAECVSACSYKPGWFMPGEAEKAAELMGLSLKDFFDKYLMVDYYTGEPDIFVLAPAIVGAQPGTVYPANPCGTCIFFQNKRCAIHAAKPFECKEGLHGQPDSVIHQRHEDIAMAWKEHQPQIEELLGEKPESNGDFSLLDNFLAWHQ